LVQDGPDKSRRKGNGSALRAKPDGGKMGFAATLIWEMSDKNVSWQALLMNQGHRHAD
jgi:hypothetical protein